MKRIFKRFTDVIGDLPDSFKPKEDVVKFTTLPPFEKDMKQFRVVVYDESAHREEGMPIVPVWERDIPGVLISRLTEWVKVQTIALQYRVGHRDINDRPLTHDSTGRVREGNRIFHSDLVNYDAWSDSIRRDHSTHAERARQLADEIRARGIDPNAPAVTAIQTMQAPGSVHRQGEAIINSITNVPIPEIESQLALVERQLLEVLGSIPSGYIPCADTVRRIDVLRDAVRTLQGGQPPAETTSQRWARERWDRSLAGRALAMHQGHEAREVDSVHDVYLRDEYQPDDPPKSE